jgi:hypothetical protein
VDSGRKHFQRGQNGEAVSCDLLGTDYVCKHRRGGVIRKFLTYNPDKPLCPTVPKWPDQPSTPRS